MRNEALLETRGHEDHETSHEELEDHETRHEEHEDHEASHEEHEDHEDRTRGGSS
jgi:hypothetical protein